MEFAPLGSGSYTLSGAMLTLNPGATIDVTASAERIDAAITDTGTLTKTGAGTLTLGGANTLGTLSVAEGAVILGATGAAGNAATLLEIRNAAAAVTHAALSFAAAGSYGQRVTVMNSGLGESTLANTATGTVTLTGGVTLDTGVTLSTAGATRTFTLSGAIDGAGGITKTGAGIVSLTGVANTFAGPVTVNAGTLSVTRWANGGLASSLGASSGAAANLTLNGGTLRYATGASVSTDRLFTLGIAGGTLEQSAASGSTLTLANTGDLGLAGSGTRTLTLSGTRAGVLATRLTDPAGGLLNLTKTGTGTWTLTHAGNAHTGVTTVTGGTLQFTTVGNGGPGTALGAHAGTAAGLVVAGTVAAPALWGHSGTTAASTDRLFTVGAGGAGAAGGVANNAAAATATLTLTNPGALAYGAADQTRTLVLAGTNTGNNSFAPLVQNNGAGLVALVKSGSGKWILPGAHTYTGATTLAGGTLEVRSLADGGAASSLGAGAGIAGNLIFSGSATLAYAGPGPASTDRLFTLGATAAGVNATLANNAAAATATLTLTNPGALAYGTVNQTRTLTLAGGNTGNNSFAPLIQNNGTGLVALVKSGSGKWILPGAHTYTGVTTLAGGTLEVTTPANGGAPSSIGAATAAAANLVFSGGTLAYAGTGTASTDRLFQIGTTGATATATVANAATTPGATLAFTNPGALTYGTVNRARTLVLRGIHPGTNVFAPLIADNGTGKVAFTKADAGAWRLTGAHTYTGVTTLAGGTLEVTTLANGGAPSSIGAATSAATNLVFSGASTLAYVGAGASTNRAFTLGTTGAVSLLNHGAGELAFTAGSLAYGTANQSRHLTLGGSNTGANTFAAALTNNGTGLTSLTKTGAGTWILSGAHTRTGVTTVSAGTLLVNGSTANSAHTVAAGATLGGSGATGAITLGGGAVLSPGAGGAGSLGTLTAASLNWAGGAELHFDLGADGASDRLALTGALTRSGVGAYRFDFMNTGASGAYTLITGSALSSGFTAAHFGYANLAPGLSGLFAYDPASGLSFTVVPEPSTCGLIGAGILTLAVMIRRRHEQSRP